MRYLLFHTRTDVFSAETLLAAAKMEYRIVPVPERTGSFCGLCIRIADDQLAQTEKILQGILYKIG